jgi:hypothetical protein
MQPLCPGQRQTWGKVANLNRVWATPPRLGMFTCSQGGRHFSLNGWVEVANLVLTSLGEHGDMPGRGMSPCPRVGGIHVTGCVAAGEAGRGCKPGQDAGHPGSERGHARPPRREPILVQVCNLYATILSWSQTDLWRKVENLNRVRATPPRLACPRAPRVIMTDHFAGKASLFILN